MNTEKLARTTFVLDRETHEMLEAVSSRLGRSRSDLIRGMVRDPVRFMYAQLQRLPPDPEGLSEAERSAVLQGIQTDLLEFIETVRSDVSSGRLS